MSDASTFASTLQDSMRAFQDQMRSFHAGTTPVAWPAATLQAFWFETPLAVATHLQKFTAGQMQAQMDLLASISREEGPANLMSKEAAFLQQSAMAWGTEMMELASLVQTKVLSAAQKPETAEPPYPLPRAA